MFCCESLPHFCACLTKRRMQRILKLLTWCSCSCVYKLSGWLIRFKHFFPSFLLQVSTKNKALQDTSQAMGMKDKLVQQKAERYHFGYDSLISFPIIIQPSRALGFPPWCWSVCLRLVLRIFTNWDMLKRIETPKEQLVKPSPSTFKLHISRQPSSSVFHPSSSDHGASMDISIDIIFFLRIQNL